MGRIEEVYIIGSGNLALSCASYIKKEGVPVSFYDTSETFSGLLERRAKKENIPYFRERAKDIFSKLQEVEKRILLVSAINEYLVPIKVLEKENITAVNLHQALLPEHPGRNAEAWAIFEQDDVSGITWHFMEERADRGAILIQRTIPLDERITSIGLFRKQIQEAFDAFREIFHPLMEGKLKGTPQMGERKSAYHFKKDVPNGGWLDVNWPPEKISAFVRAMDYGGLSVWEPSRIRLEEGCFSFRDYRLSEHTDGSGEESLRITCERPEDAKTQEWQIVIQKGKLRLQLNHCKKVEEETWKN